jgi:hypothetical protein
MSGSAEVVLKDLIRICKVPCPTCKAPSGMLCELPGSNGVPAWHKEREAAWNEANPHANLVAPLPAEDPRAGPGWAGTYPDEEVPSSFTANQLDLVSLAIESYLEANKATCTYAEEGVLRGAQARASQFLKEWKMKNEKPHQEPGNVVTLFFHYGGARFTGDDGSPKLMFHQFAEHRPVFDPETNEMHGRIVMPLKLHGQFITWDGVSGGPSEPGTPLGARKLGEAHGLELSDGRKIQLPNLPLFVDLSETWLLMAPKAETAPKSAAIKDAAEKAGVPVIDVPAPKGGA